MFAQRIAVWKATESYADCIPMPPASRKLRWLDCSWNVALVGMSVSVQDQDCLEAGKALLDAGHSPLVLNLSDYLVPGGCVAAGSGAQEESIWRMTNYCKTLTQDFYPIQNDEAVYSPQVTVFQPWPVPPSTWK